MAAVAPSPAEVIAWAWTDGAKAKLHRKKLESRYFMIVLTLMLQSRSIAKMGSRDNLPIPEIAQKYPPREDSNLLMNTFHPFIANH